MTGKSDDEVAAVQIPRGLNYQAAIDLALVVFTLIVTKQLVLPYSFLYAGPVSTLSAMIVTTIIKA